jgi:hypothetical protein
VPTTKETNGKTMMITKNENGIKFKIAKKATVIAVMIAINVKFSTGFSLFLNMFILKLYFIMNIKQDFSKNIEVLQTF